MPDFVGRFANKRDVYQQVASIHAECINKGFLHTLGERFLTLLYEAIDYDPKSVLFVELLDDEVVGFVSGGLGMGSVYWQLAKRWPRLLMALLPVLARPSKLKRVFEIIWFSRKQKPVEGCPRAELFSIALLSDARGKGCAERLYQSLCQYFVDNNEHSFCIVVGSELARAHSFYLRMGASPTEEVSVHQGAPSILYRHDLVRKE